MHKVVMMALLLLLAASWASPKANPALRANDLKSIKGLPFSALIFFESKSDVRFFIGILMDQDDISEDNLRLLFRSLSEKYPLPDPLEAQVYTDMWKPSALTRNEVISVDGKTKGQSSAPHGAFYLRRQSVELFRFNPNYPEHGMKTVVLRGKE